MSVVYPARVVGIDFSSASNGPLGIVLHSTSIHGDRCTIKGAIVDDSAIIAFGTHTSCCKRTYIIEEA